MNNVDQPRRPLFRMVAIGSAALFLLSTAYQASWGQGGGGNYGDNDNGLSGGEIAAIAVGGAGAAYGLWLLLGADDDDDDETTEATYAPGVSTGGKAAAARLVAPTSKLAAGDNAVLDLQVQRGGKWVSVTNEHGSTIQVSGVPLTRMDGAKNAFAVPMTAGSGTAQAVGRYTQPVGTVLTAHTVLSVGG